MNQDNSGRPHGPNPMPYNSQPAGMPRTNQPEPPFEDLPPVNPQGQPQGAYNPGQNFDYNPQPQGPGYQPSPEVNHYTGPYNPQAGDYNPMNQAGFTGPLPGAGNPYEAPYNNQATGQFDAYQAGQAYASRPQGPQQGRPRPHGPRPARPGKPAGSNYDFNKQIGEFSGLFKHYFSSNPSKALNQDLSLVSWVILLVANILFYALAQATFASQGVAAALASLGEVGGLFGGLMGAETFNWGSSFGLALVQQALVLLLYFLAAWIFSGMGGEAKLPVLQYLKLISYTTVLHTILHFVIIFISLISVGFAGTLLVLAKYTLFFSFTYVLDSIYPKSRSSRYWLYFILLFLVTLVG